MYALQCSNKMQTANLERIRACLDQIHALGYKKQTGRQIENINSFLSLSP